MQQEILAYDIGIALGSISDSDITCSNYHSQSFIFLGISWQKSAGSKRLTVQLIGNAHICSLLIYLP